MRISALPNMFTSALKAPSVPILNQKTDTFELQHASIQQRFGFRMQQDIEEEDKPTIILPPPYSVDQPSDVPLDEIRDAATDPDELWERKQPTLPEWYPQPEGEELIPS